MIYSESGCSSSAALPEGNLLMPDRASAPPCNCPSLKKYLIKVGGNEEEKNPAVWQLKDPSPVYSFDEEEELDREILNKHEVY